MTAEKNDALPSAAAYKAPAQGAFLPAFDVDFNMRCEGNRLLTIYRDEPEQPVKGGDLVVAVCIESGQDGGFAALCRVHTVGRTADGKAWRIDFDWLPQHMDDEVMRAYVSRLWADEWNSDEDAVYDDA